MTSRDWLVLAAILSPMAVYVYGAIALDWDLNDLSAAFFIGAFVAGLIGGLGLARTTTVYLEGMASLLPAALLVGVARAISVALTQGRVIDTILVRLSAPLEHVAGMTAAVLMIPFHAAVHVVVPSVSGQAMLTMPLLVPLSDLIGLSRQVTVAAYQTGGGLTDLLTPTNGALMAILLAAGVPYQKWLKFAAVGTVAAALVGLAGMLALRHV